MANYNGGYGNSGGYGSNPYEQEGDHYNQNAATSYGEQYNQRAANPYVQQGGQYDQNAGNPYAQRQQPPPSNRYDDRQQGYGRTQGGGGGGATYGGGNDVEMTAMNGRNAGSGAQRGGRSLLSETTDLQAAIKATNAKLKEIRDEQTRAAESPDSQSAADAKRDALGAEVMTAYRGLAGRLKALKQKPESGNSTNRAQVALTDRLLKQGINDFQKIERDYRQETANKMARQYRIVRPDASDAEIREAIEDTSNNQVFSQALMSSTRRGESSSALREVQNRHNAIQKIERDMIELAQLFQDMEQAIIEQEPAIENIDKQGENTVENLDKGNQHLVQAVDKARAARRKKWICLGLVVAIIAIIVIIVVVVVEVVHNK